MGRTRASGVGDALPLPVTLGLLVAAAGIILDQATKELAEALLRRGEFVSLLGEHIGWQLVYNPGGAFGMAAPPLVFLIVTLIVLAIVARVLPHTESLLQATAYGLLVSGALGNMVDRVLRPGGDGLLGGHVVDFVAWSWWPRFNVADSAITVGFALLVVALVLEERRTRRQEAAGQGEDEAEGTDESEGSMATDGAGGATGDQPDAEPGAPLHGIGLTEEPAGPQPPAAGRREDADHGGHAEDDEAAEAPHGIGLAEPASADDATEAPRSPRRR